MILDKESLPISTNPKLLEMHMKVFLAILTFLSLIDGWAQQTTLEQANELIGLNEFAEAEELLKSALNTGNDDQLRNVLGEVYGYQAKWDKAIDIYQSLTKNNPKNAEYQFRYGGVLARKAQSTSKIKALMLVGKMKGAFLKAAELDSKHLNTRWALVDMYISLPGLLGGSTSKAYRYAKELKSLSHIDGYLALGYVYEYDAEPEKAKNSYLKAMEYVDELGKVDRNQLHYQIGKVSGDYQLRIEKGIYHMEQYIENYSVLDGVPLQWAYYRMSKLYRHSGDKKNALKWINKALTLQPEFEQAKEEKKKVLVL